MAIENIPDEKGIETLGSVTACATAAHAATLGTPNAQCSASAARIQGYADVNSTNIPGARKIDMTVPIA